MSIRYKKYRFLKIVFPVMIILMLLTHLFSFITLGYVNNIKKEKNEDRDISNILFDLKVKIYMKLLKSPSLIVCVIKNDSVVWNNSYGHSNFYLRKKASLDTIYTIGSISKCVTGTAFMKIFENESYNVDLDDNISRWLPFDLKNPSFPKKNITFRMLLGHRSSIIDNFDDLLKINEFDEDPIIWTREHLVKGGKYFKNDYWGENKPGENCSYSSFAFVVLSGLIESISGLKFDDFCQKNLFKPLNMTNTSYDINKLNKKNFARPYFPSLFGYIPFVHYDAKIMAACGGLRTNVFDLSNFLIMHMNDGMYKNKRILSKSTIEEMHALYDPDFEGYWFHGGIINFGLAWAHLDINGKHWEGYNGGAVGYSCDMATLPSENIGVIMLSNNHFYRFMTPYYDRYQYHDPLATLLIQKAE